MLHRSSEIVGFRADGLGTNWVEVKFASMVDIRRNSDLAILATREAEALPISCRTAQRLTDDRCDSASQSLRLEKPVSQKLMMSSISALLLT